MRVVFILKNICENYSKRMSFNSTFDSKMKISKWSDTFLEKVKANREKFINMSLADKRKYNRSYITLDKILTWPNYYTKNDLNANIGKFVLK